MAVPVKSIAEIIAWIIKLLLEGKSEKEAIGMASFVSGVPERKVAQIWAKHKKD